MYVQQPQIMLSNSYFAVFSRIRQTGNHFIEKRAGFQSELVFSFARVCRKLVGFSKSLLTILCASQSYSPCVTQKTYKMCSDLSDSLWQKLAHFFKSEFTFWKTSTHDHSGKRAHLWKLQYIPRNMHTVFALLCFVVVIHWLIFPYRSGLLHWHCGNLTIAPVPAKQPWWIWINTSCEFIMNDCIPTTKGIFIYIYMHISWDIL